MRLVAHLNLPKTLEGFYQESGRAGRDGLPSRSVLFYDVDDRERMDYILSESFIPLLKFTEKQEHSETQKSRLCSENSQA